MQFLGLQVRVGMIIVFFGLSLIFKQYLLENWAVMGFLVKNTNLFGDCEQMQDLHKFLNLDPLKGTLLIQELDNSQFITLNVLP